MSIKIKQKIINSAIAVLLPLVALLSSPVTQAYDGKMYSGGQCMALNGGEVQYFGNFTRGFYNNHPSAYKIATCALTRDRQFNTDGINNLWVWVTPQFSHQMTTCSITIISHDSNHHYNKSLSRTGAGYINLGSMPSSHGTGSYIVYCNLPPKAFLNHIQLREHSGTDTNN